MKENKNTGHDLRPTSQTKDGNISETFAFVFIIAFNMMKNLVETFTIKLFALINVFSKVEPPFCMIFFKTLYEVPLI